MNDAKRERDVAERERDGYKLQLEGVKALAVEAEKAHAAELAEVTAALPKCGTCDKPAVCFGSYESNRSHGFACDSCCGHGSEDGWCTFVFSDLGEYINGIVEEKRIEEEEHEKTNADLHAAVATAAQHEKALEAARARCAMLAEALRKVEEIACRSVGPNNPEDVPEPANRDGEELAEVSRIALSTSDAGVAEWLEGVKAEAHVVGRKESRAAAYGVLGVPEQADFKEALAAHDAQAEAKAFEKAARHFEGDSTGLARNAIARELRALAGRDGTTL